MSLPALLIVAAFVPVVLWALVVMGRQPALGISIVVLFATNVFGTLHGNRMPGVPVPGAGRVNLADVLLLVSVLFVSLRILAQRRLPATPGFAVPILGLLVLIALQVGRGLAEGVAPNDLFQALRQVAYYVLFVVVAVACTRERQLYALTWGLIVIGAGTGVSSVLQFSMGQAFSGAALTFARDIDAMRVYQAGDVALEFALFATIGLIAMEWPKWKWPLLMALVLCSGGLLVSFARSAWGGALLGSALMVALLRSRMRRGAVRGMFLAGAVLLLVFFVASAGGRLTADQVSTRLASGLEDLRTGAGSMGVRLAIMSVKWAGVSEQSPLIGQGFHWPGYREDIAAGNLYVQANPLAPSGDNGIASLFVIFGYTGLVLFCVIVALVVWHGVRLLRRNTLTPRVHAVVASVVAFNLESVGIAFFSGRYHRAPEVALVAVSWGLLYGAHYLSGTWERSTDGGRSQGSVPSALPS